MGLTVKVYKNIHLTNSKSEYDFRAFVIDENWKYKIKNIQEGKFYNGDCVDNSISYPCSSHNRFREKLIKLIDITDLLKSDGTIDWENLPSDIPFFDFIDFADNEGCLDWEISEKIYKDFKTYETKAQDQFNKFYEFDLYKSWLKVFELARHNGVVVFS